MNRREIIRSAEKLISGILAVWIFMELWRGMTIPTYAFYPFWLLYLSLPVFGVYAIWRPRKLTQQIHRSPGFDPCPQPSGWFAHVLGWVVLITLAGFLVVSRYL